MIFGQEISDINKMKIALRSGYVEYSKKEKFLGCNFLEESNNLGFIMDDLNERSADVKVKLNNFLHNHIHLSLIQKQKVLEACFTSRILYGCETWGRKAPPKYKSLYNYGIKNVLGVRQSTPNVIANLEYGCKSLDAQIISRQINFFLSLNDKLEVQQLIN